LANKVPKYPVSAQQMVSLARKSGAPAEVADFYKSFQGEVSEDFDSKEDLVSRSEQVRMFSFDDQPYETYYSSEED
jgi:hypothetical protein